MKKTVTAMAVLETQQRNQKAAESFPDCQHKRPKPAHQAIIDIEERRGSGWIIPDLGETQGHGSLDTAIFYRVQMRK